MTDRYLGIDVGAETVKVVELTADGPDLRWTDRRLVEHDRQPGPHLLRLLEDLDWENVRGASVTGRLGRLVELPRIPVKQAQAAGHRFLHGVETATIVSIGSHGFSVLEVLPTGIDQFRQNSRCSQGTGNFLRQLVERFQLTVEEASRLCEDVEDPAPLSGRCPVILKSDMTHLANRGECRAGILAGLYDAVCENVFVLVKPRSSPPLVRMLGGVSRSRRIRDTFGKLLERRGLELAPPRGDEELFYEALGSAVLAAGERQTPPALGRLLGGPEENGFEEVPALADFLAMVDRRSAPPLPDVTGQDRPVVVGYDIGSTGSKAVALDVERREVVWQGYVNTNGDPVGAAHALTRDFLAGPAGDLSVMAVGTTGSGREIAGSLLASCFGAEAVFILNEIAAHAEGALHYDPDVDTIFEIGGQDAKYARLEQGRVIDAAMNEACSAGTGSFIEEQGKKFADIESVVQLGEQALSACRGASLGQHCSVFMAEVIDECVAAGVEQQTIVAGLFDSVIQNYLNRVKGKRSVGQVIFCQGMPFSSDALAAAVARQTGSRVIVPPNPGTIGALGIALLTPKERELEGREPVDLARFLEAQITRKDTFVCGSTKGCGGSGNHCRIDRISTEVAGKRGRFTWGGGCSLHDRGTGRTKLPDRAPQPFREREELAGRLAGSVEGASGRPRVAFTDEFVLKSLFPFFATYLRELGFDIDVRRGGDRATLKRGIEEAHVPFCAPMQLFHGIASEMSGNGADYVFLPMLKSLPRVGDEEFGVVCPISQASPDILNQDLNGRDRSTVISPTLDMGVEGLDSPEFRKGCREIARLLHVPRGRWKRAHAAAVEAQAAFDQECGEIGRRALVFCEEHDVLPVVVIGRSYTIYNDVLNSNVPALLREQGALAIPVDCYPVGEDVPVFRDMYWGQGQRNLRAAHQVRRTGGVYSIFCSNYACGPDSFGVQFYTHVMEGKPTAIIETDGHSGDAGTKTRVEAFLYCVREHLQATGREDGRKNELDRTEKKGVGLREILDRGETLLLPWFGALSDAMNACLGAVGLDTEVLPMPDHDAMRRGRRHTSGKECMPMWLTLGSVLQRIQTEADTEKRFAYLMPKTEGPCRFGTYNLAQKLIFDSVGLGERVRIWSPSDRDYFAEFPPGFAAVTFAGIAACDLLTSALYDVRPVERTPGAAQAVHEKYRRELIALLEKEAAKPLSRPTTILEVLGGRVYGIPNLLRRAAEAFRAVRGEGSPPRVLVVGEIYLRLVPSANGFVVDELERRGLRVSLAPASEWFEYVKEIARMLRGSRDLGLQVSYALQRRIASRTYGVVAKTLGWPARTTIPDAFEAAAPYLRRELQGEAVLTLGGPLKEWDDGHIDGVLSVGPLECMPSKIAETQFFHAAQARGMPVLNLARTGEPTDPEILDNFAYEVHTRHRKQRESVSTG